MSETQLPTPESVIAGEGIYLFCFTLLPLPLELADSGLDGRRPLTQLRYRIVTAVCCSVERADFCGPGAESRLSDVDWVGPRALRHQQVVESVMRHAPVLPCRFGTLFSSPTPLASLLEQHHPSIARFLQFVSDKEEWSAKGFLDASRAEA